jgi:hypothetical protein
VNAVRETLGEIIALVAFLIWAAIVWAWNHPVPVILFVIFCVMWAGFVGVGSQISELLSQAAAIEKRVEALQDSLVELKENVSDYKDEQEHNQSNVAERLERIESTVSEIDSKVDLID